MRTKMLFIIVCLGILLSAGNAQQPFMRGDANQNGVFSISDAVGILHYIFSGKPFSCHDALDVNDNGTVTIADAIGLLHFLFHNGEAPAQPYPGCGVDTSDDALDCMEYNPDICSPPEPPPCLSAEEFSDSVSFIIERPLCLPSPFFETELLGSKLVICPEGSLCSDDQPGCELVFKGITAEADFAGGELVATLSVSAALPVEFGQILCSTEIDIEGTVSMEIIMEPSQWDGIREIKELTAPEFLISSFEIDASGGIGCGLLELSGPVLQALLQSALDESIPDLVDTINIELGRMYVCTEDT